MRKEKLKDMREHPLVFVDLETTGIIPADHEIIEIGYLIVDQNSLRVQKEQAYQIQVKHIEKADAESLQIIRYEQRDWSAAVPLREALERFTSDATGGILIGQNIAVDWAFLRAAFSEVGLEDTMQYHRLDIMSMAFALMRDEPSLKKFSLSELAKFFGVETGEAHAALDDVKATFEVYKKLLERMRV